MPLNGTPASIIRMEEMTIERRRKKNRKSENLSKCLFDSDVCVVYEN